ncbi:transcription factor grauzone-like [Anopheles cruzii]|uniref:transcription factor grauzone-like n=1 Tax=Anopheles cruzii TaxID=68878 RepID=UPI0022EC5CFB|nr:transcription factor grauzone-like [Anopheles cruzii]
MLTVRDLRNAPCSFCCAHHCSGQLYRLSTVELWKKAVRKHFWFEDEMLNDLWMCSICWQRVHDFSSFYDEVKERLKTHTKSTATGTLSRTIDIEVLLKEECISDAETVPSIHAHDEDALHDPLNTAQPDRGAVEDLSSATRIRSTFDASKADKRHKTSPHNCSASTEMSATVNDSLKITAADIGNHYSLRCSDCNANFATFGDLQKHCKSLHDTVAFVECCDRKFKRYTNIREHIVYHRDPNAFRCKECPRTFSTSRYLHQHHSRTHLAFEQKRHLCDKCSDRFATRYMLMMHERTHYRESAETAEAAAPAPKHEPHPCEQCAKAFSTSAKLEKHVNRVHRRSDSSSKMCDICSKILYNKYSLEKHRRTHFNEHPTVQCTVCGKWLKNEETLRIHLSMHRQENMEFICTFCNHRSPSRIALRSHVLRNHEKKRTHQCSFCEKAFVQANLLKDHIATHTGEYLYHCKFCDKQFKCNSNMSKHVTRLHPFEWAEYKKRKNMPPEVICETEQRKKTVNRS